MSEGRRTSTCVVHEHKSAEFQQELNECMEEIEDNGGTVIDVKFSFAYEEIWNHFCALVIYDYPIND